MMQLIKNDRIERRRNNQNIGAIVAQHELYARNTTQETASYPKAMARMADLLQVEAEYIAGKFPDDVELATVVDNLAFYAGFLRSESG